MSLSVHQCATLACLLDVTTPKPGNVHRGADFADMTFLDFAKSAVAIGPVMEEASSSALSIGKAVLRSIQATRTVTSTNTNLGIVLLFAPLAKASTARAQGLGAVHESLADVLAGLSPEDASDVFEAIRVACPGGLGEVDEMDVNHDPAPTDLIAAMKLAADRDLVARQYGNGFEDVFQIARDIEAAVQEHELTLAILNTYLKLLSQEPDSLIRRKCGLETAREVSARASAVLNAGGLGSSAFESAISEFDFWLRADGNRRNPGTTADMITAGLFVGLLVDSIQLR